MTDIDNISSNSNYSFLKDKEEDKQIDIDYDSLVNLPAKDFSQELDDDEKNEVIFYCRSCKHVTEVERVEPQSRKQKKIQFMCTSCKKKNVFYGTKRGIDAYFHLNG